MDDVRDGGGGVSDQLVGTSDYLLAICADTDVAIVDGGREVSYAELRVAAGRLYAELEALDLPAGARIGILASNSLFWVASYLAAMKGFVAVPFSEKSTSAEIARQAVLVRCSSAFVDRRHQRTLGAALEGLRVISEDALISDRPPVWPPPSPVARDADAALMFTSGTTADPKAVRVTHGNLQANTESIIGCLGLGRDDRMLVVLPFSYSYGASLLHTHLRVGGSVVLCNTFTFPETAVEMIRDRSCTGFAGVPSTYQLLLQASSFKTAELPSLRLLQQAGGKLSPVLIQEIVAARPGVDVHVMYGQTEATARLSMLPPDRVLDKLGSIGRGMPGVELAVVDDAGKPVAPGIRGEIIAAGANISPGYYEDCDATAAKFPGGRLRTGDVATVDDEGFIFIIDRKADFIKTWGYRVSSQAIEAAALTLTDLVSAAAIGVPDADAGEVIVLFASVRSGTVVSKDDIRVHLRNRLARHMLPSAIHLIDSMPMNASGKLSKWRLRELAVDLGHTSN